MNIFDGRSKDINDVWGLSWLEASFLPTQCVTSCLVQWSRMSSNTTTLKPTLYLHLINILGRVLLFCLKEEGQETLEGSYLQRTKGPSGQGIRGGTGLLCGPLSLKSSFLSKRTLN